MVSEQWGIAFLGSEAQYTCTASAMPALSHAGDIHAHLPMASDAFGCLEFHDTDQLTDHDMIMNHDGFSGPKTESKFDFSDIQSA